MAYFFSTYVLINRIGTLILNHKQAFKKTNGFFTIFQPSINVFFFLAVNPIEHNRFLADIPERALKGESGQRSEPGRPRLQTINFTVDIQKVGNVQEGRFIFFNVFKVMKHALESDHIVCFPDFRYIQNAFVDNLMFIGAWIVQIEGWLQTLNTGVSTSYQERHHAAVTAADIQYFVVFGMRKPKISQEEDEMSVLDDPAIFLE